MTKNLHLKKHLEFEIDYWNKRYISLETKINKINNYFSTISVIPISEMNELSGIFTELNLTKNEIDKRKKIFENLFDVQEPNQEPIQEPIQKPNTLPLEPTNYETNILNQINNIMERLIIL